MPTRLAAASTAKHACAWDGGAYTWKPKSGTGPTLKLVTNGSWMPGADFTRARFTDLPPRGMYVERDGVISKGVGDKYHPIGHVGVVGHGDDITNPGVQGGYMIDLAPPAEPSYAVMDCTIARSPVALPHTATGALLTRENALGSWFEYRLDRTPEHTSGTSIQTLPHFLTQPMGDPMAWSVRAHDQYHAYRAYQHALGLWRRDQDPIARWFILTLAEDARIAWTMNGKPQDAGSSWVPFSLRSLLAAAEANPGKGGTIVRGWAEILQLFAAALEVGAPNRTDFELTIGGMMRYAQLVQMPSGALYSAVYGYGMDQDEPVLVFNLPTNKQWTTSWQHTFACAAIDQAMIQFPSTQRKGKIILTGLKKLWGPATPRVPGEDGQAEGLPRYLVTAIDGMPVPMITDGVGPARSMYDQVAFDVFARWGIQ